MNSTYPIQRNPLKQAIFLEASHKKSESDIARELNVSHSTVNRIIHTSYEEHPLHFNSLPKVLSVKSAEGAMSFIFCDASNGKLIDIVEDRRLSTLKPYFMRFSKEAREGVTHVVIDMYALIFCDASNGKLIDIVEDRRLSTLKPYFMRFSKEAREGVTHVVIDMYAPYMTLIKEVFPNAKIVLVFHAIF